MENNEAKKTMRFWIVSGVVAIFASQLPLFIKKNQVQKASQEQQQQKKKSKWMMLLIGVLVLGLILWLFSYIV